MRRRTPHPLPGAVLALVCAAAGCGGGEEAPESQAPGVIRVVDAAGREHVLQAPARRIVSLVPSATQTFRALGAADRLVGRTDFDTARWARNLPSVGGGLEPNLEALVALDPDLVVRFEGGQDPRTPTRLDEIGIRHLAVRPDRIEDVLEITRLLGHVTGRDAAADSLVERIRSDLDAVRARVSSLDPVRTAYVLGGTPPWVAGPDTYIDDILRLAGGVNAFGDLGSRYAPVSPEELAARPLDVILVPEGTSFDRSLRPGVRVEETGSLLELPGPEVARAARLVADLLHPRRDR